MFMTPYFHAIREYTSSPTNHMNEEDRRASRVPIRAVRHLHSRGGRPTPGYLNWDDDDGVWRNNHGETPEEGRARQAQRMEQLILSTLSFELTSPSAFVFFCSFATVAGMATAPRSTTELLANYLIELTLQEDRMRVYLPSLLCAAAIWRTRTSALTLTKT